MLEANPTNQPFEKPKYRYYVRQGFDEKPVFQVLDTTTQRVVKQGLDAHIIIAPSNDPEPAGSVRTPNPSRKQTQ